VKVFFKCSHFLKKRGGRFAFFSKLSSSFSCGNSDLLLRFFFKQKKDCGDLSGTFVSNRQPKGNEKSSVCDWGEGKFFLHKAKRKIKNPLHTT